MSDSVLRDIYDVLIEVRDELRKRNADELREIDRNARAYGWEVGHGQPLGRVLLSVDSNPFLMPGWRQGVVSDV